MKKLLFSTSKLPDWQKWAEMIEVLSLALEQCVGGQTSARLRHSTGRQCAGAFRQDRRNDTPLTIWPCHLQTTFKTTQQ